MGLEASANDFVRVSGCAGNHFAEEHSRREAVEMSVSVLFGFGHSGSNARKPLFEDLVERELDCDMSEAKEGGCETGVEGQKPFATIHFSSSIEGVVVMPRWSVVIASRSCC